MTLYSNVFLLYDNPVTVFVFPLGAAQLRPPSRQSDCTQAWSFYSDEEMRDGLSSTVTDED